jgi:hypothetical protein
MVSSGLLVKRGVRLRETRSGKERKGEHVTWMQELKVLYTDTVIKL